LPVGPICGSTDAKGTHVRQAEVGLEAVRLAEHHVARARISAVRIGVVCSDDHVIKAVSVDVASRGNRTAVDVA
jgi:hypothetical protein